MSLLCRCGKSFVVQKNPFSGLFVGFATAFQQPPERLSTPFTTFIHRVWKTEIVVDTTAFSFSSPQIPENFPQSFPHNVENSPVEDCRYVTSQPCQSCRDDISTTEPATFCATGFVIPTKSWYFSRFFVLFYCIFIKKRFSNTFPHKLSTGCGKLLWKSQRVILK